MKFQPRRFVVEVKRGTNRSAFASPDTAPDKFSGAEELLFGKAAKKSPVLRSADAETSAAPGRRILESLIEPPPPPVVEVQPERPRRGRKPGSKNKPKLPGLVTVAAALGPSEDDLPLSAADPVAESAPRRGGAMAGARAEDDILPVGPPGAGDEVRIGAGRAIRIRLRDRSTILKRYVLESEPRPGQPGSLRARKAARDMG